MSLHWDFLGILANCWISEPVFWTTGVLKWRIQNQTIETPEFDYHDYVMAQLGGQLPHRLYQHPHPDSS